MRADRPDGADQPRLRPAARRRGRLHRRARSTGCCGRWRSPSPAEVRGAAAAARASPSSPRHFVERHGLIVIVALGEIGGRAGRRPRRAATSPPRPSSSGRSRAAAGRGPLVGLLRHRTSPRAEARPRSEADPATAGDAVPARRSAVAFVPLLLRDRPRSPPACTSRGRSSPLAAGRALRPAPALLAGGVGPLPRRRGDLPGVPRPEAGRLAGSPPPASTAGHRHARQRCSRPPASSPCSRSSSSGLLVGEARGRARPVPSAPAVTARRAVP